LKRILFIGLGESSHTSSWISALDGSDIDARLFALPTGALPDSRDIPTYLAAHRFLFSPKEYEIQAIPFFGRFHSALLSITNQTLTSLNRVALIKKFVRFLNISLENRSTEKSLRSVIRRFSPDAIHTLGLFDSSTLYFEVKKDFPNIPWIVQVRGGPDLELNEQDPLKKEKILQILSSANYIICDSETNYARIKSYPNTVGKFPLGVMSGTGGMDISRMLCGQDRPTLKTNRLIVFPKAYEAVSSKATPVFEAINIAWDQIKPVQFRFLWMNQPELIYWMKKTLRAEILDSITTYQRITRHEAIEHIREAQVLLAPSLMDGIPNSMLEAMTVGAIPIVSPLESISSLVSGTENVIFARNLYPEEIAEALIQALSHSVENEKRIKNNFDLVSKNYNRDEISQQLISFYHYC
jgi:glycosyltransferase involved in cell wall biosynthesis